MVRCGQEPPAGTANRSGVAGESTNGRGAVEVLKVSTRSNPNAIAGAMAGVIRQSGTVEVQVVGAGALNQAIKALAIARGYVAEAGIDLVCVPTFADIEIDGERRTAIRLHIDDRSHRLPDPALLADVAIVLEGHSEYTPDAVPTGDLAARTAR